MLYNLVLAKENNEWEFKIERYDEAKQKLDMLIPSNNANIPKFIRLASSLSSEKRILIKMEQYGLITAKDEELMTLVVCCDERIKIWKDEFGVGAKHVKTTADLSGSEQRCIIVSTSSLSVLSIDLGATKFEEIIIDSTDDWIGWQENCLNEHNILKWEMNMLTKITMEISFNIEKMIVISDVQLEPMKCFPMLKILDSELGFMHYASRFAGATFIEGVGLFAPNIGRAVEFKMFLKRFVKT